MHFKKDIPMNITIFQREYSFFICSKKTKLNID